jgi:hypothetical protein
MTAIPCAHVQPQQLHASRNTYGLHVLEERTHNDLHRQCPGAFCLLVVLHANAEQISKSNLGDIICNVLIVLEVCIIDACVAGLDFEIRLKNRIRTQVLINPCQIVLTIFTPFSDGWTDSASFHRLGPVKPWPQLNNASQLCFL